MLYNIGCVLNTFPSEGNVGNIDELYQFILSPGGVFVESTNCFIPAINKIVLNVDSKYFHRGSGPIGDAPNFLNEKNLTFSNPH